MAVATAVETVAGMVVATDAVGVLETPRLNLRWLDPERDAAFVLELVNEPGWLRYIGDKGVHTLADARAYIEKGPPSIAGQPVLRRFAIVPREAPDAEPLGICGLVKREVLAEPDLGFALLARHGGHSYAFEAAVAVLAHERALRGIGTVKAITSPDNAASQRLLLRLGFVREPDLSLSADAAPVHCYAQRLGDGAVPAA